MTTANVKNLKGYRRHIVSDVLADRYPYLENIRGHLKPDEVSTAAGTRLFPRLVEQLKNPTMPPERLTEALITICDLISHQERKCDAIASDVVAAATNLLLHSSVPVRREAARVIAGVALLLGARSLMPLGNAGLSRTEIGNNGSGPTLPRLVKLLLSCDDELVKQHTAEAFAAITIFRDGCEQMVEQGAVKGTARYLCATLPELPATRPLGICLMMLLKTLAAVAMYAKVGMRDILGVGLIAKVVTLLGRIPLETGIPVITLPESIEMVRHAMRLLWFCGNHAEGRRETLKADAVSVITWYLRHSDAKVREAAVCALNVVSLETAGKKEVLKHSLDPLSQLLHSEEETTYLHETCVQLVRCAAELPAFRFAFTRHNLQSIWLLEKVFSTTALAALAPLLEPAEDIVLRNQAAIVMAHFLLAEKPGKGDDIRVPPVSPPDLIDSPRRYALEECVALLPNLLRLLEVNEDGALKCFDALMDEPRVRKELQAHLDERREPVPTEASRKTIEALLKK